MNTDKTVCKVISYKKDIEPFPLVKIYAGVGSGKSFFASRMILGSKEYGIPKQNVLIITSRRSKVEETLKELGKSITKRITKNGNLSYEIWQTGEERPEEYEDYLKEIKIKTELGEISYLTYNKSVVCTNAYISAYLRYVYDPNDPTTHIWNKFDSIIIDEAHSLVTDSTYQSSTFDVIALIREYLSLYQNNQLQECACKHLILMTGTHQPLETHLKLNFPDKLTNKRFLYDQCKNVVPQNIILIDKQSSQSRIRELLMSGEKVIYFTNYTLTESAARVKFNLPDIINIGVSFTKTEKKKTLSKEEQEKITGIEESLASNSRIPDDIQLFVTTSRNKEGINIHNTDYCNMFVDTHLLYDVVQMAGRVRSGIQNLYIITNAEQFDYKNRLVDVLFSKKVMVANKDYSDSANEANIYLENEYSNDDNNVSAYRLNYIDYIESKFSYVRYNVFTREFEFFHIKEDAEDMANSQIQKFEEAVLMGDDSGIAAWFPESEILREISLKERGKIYLDKVIGVNKWVVLSKEQLRQHLTVIRDMFCSNYKNANAILHLVDELYNCNDSGKKFLLYYGTEDPRIKKKAMKKRGKRQ